MAISIPANILSQSGDYGDRFISLGQKLQSMTSSELAELSHSFYNY